MSGLPSAKILTGLPKMEWKTPRDKEAFLGYLVGGRRDTREEIGKELRKRYGIKIWKSFGEEMKKTPGAIFIDPRAEVVIFLADDIPDSVLKKVLECCKVAGMIPAVGINRKEKHRWDFSFAAMGYNNPPGWLTIPNIADPDRLETQRLAEQAALDAMEKPRPAYVEEAKVTIGDKLKLIVQPKPEDIINKYIPGKNKEPAIVPALPRTKPVAPKGTLKPGERSPNAGATPLGAALIKAREARGMTQGEAARAMGVSQGNLSSYERGSAIPLYASFVRMQDFLGPLPEPADMLGRKSYEARGGAVIVRGQKQTQAKLTAKEAFGGGNKPAVEAVKPEPVAPAPAPPPVAVAAPPAPAQPVAQVDLSGMFASGEERVTVKLKSGGTITLSISVSLLKLKGPDRKFVFEMIDALQAYEEEKKE